MTTLAPREAKCSASAAPKPRGRRQYFLRVPDCPLYHNVLRDAPVMMASLPSKTLGGDILLGFQNRVLMADGDRFKMVDNWTILFLGFDLPTMHSWGGTAASLYPSDHLCFPGLSHIMALGVRLAVRFPCPRRKPRFNNRGFP
jgi:hypothetical protein